MIPKKLHYVWVGENEMPKRIQKIISNSKKILGPKWKIKIWTEKEFDINSNPFTKHWYNKKNWSFVSDYIRAYAVFLEGGFYTDTDVFLEKTLDFLTKYDYVASRTYITENTMSIFGAKRGHDFLKKYMDVLTHPKITKIQPKIMATHIHTYVLSQAFEIPVVDEDFIKDGFALLKESKLQLKLDNECIAIHEHHDNWKGKKNDIKVSKYYWKKVNFYKNLSPSLIRNQEKYVKKFNKKINNLINK